MCSLKHVYTDQQYIGYNVTRQAPQMLIHIQIMKGSYLSAVALGLEPNSAGSTNFSGDAD